MKRAYLFRKFTDFSMTWLMRLCLLGAALLLGSILFTITSRGLAALNWDMLTKPPERAFYLGGEGGILNAITGSLLLALGATALASLIAIPAVLYLHTYGRRSGLRHTVRLALDVMWGTPSLVFGVFVFATMLLIGLRASLLAGILALALVILPILTRTFDEVLTLVPGGLREATLALGTNRRELATMLLRQSLPGLFAALFLAFARAIGDGASVLFTAGYTDAMPQSLLRPVASLPLAIYFQLSTPFPAVQARAHAAALVLTVMVLLFGILGYVSLRRFGRHVIR
jgi:phosphate transport system permease protein